MFSADFATFLQVCILAGVGIASANQHQSATPQGTSVQFDAADALPGPGSELAFLQTNMEVTAEHGSTSLIREDQDNCKEDDAALAKWTVLRYLVIGAIISYRVVLRMDMERSLTEWPRQFFVAGFDFAISEGVGLVIYFVVSVIMDNIAIFLIHSDTYCGYVKMVALYSMALVTFLPNCGFAYCFQPRMYDNGSMMMKLAFVFSVIVITILSFFFRLYLVYILGWADVLKRILTPLHCKVVIAVLVPPVVDGLQSALLIASSRLAEIYSTSKNVEV